MARARDRLRELEQEVHDLRHEAGVGRVFAWICERQTELDRKWYDVTDIADINRMQGEARVLAKLRRVIEGGPVIGKS